MPGYYEPDHITSCLGEAQFVSPRLPLLLKAIADWIEQDDVNVASLIVQIGPEDFSAFEEGSAITPHLSWRGSLVFQRKEREA